MNPFVQEYNQNSIFSQAYGKSLPPCSKPDAPMMHQEPSLYSLFEGTPWSPSLPASSGTSQLLSCEHDAYICIGAFGRCNVL